MCRHAKEMWSNDKLYFLGLFFWCRYGMTTIRQLRDSRDVSAVSQHLELAVGSLSWCLIWLSYIPCISDKTGIDTFLSSLHENSMFSGNIMLQEQVNNGLNCWHALLFSFSFFYLILDFMSHSSLPDFALQRVQCPMANWAHCNVFQGSDIFGIWQWAGSFNVTQCVSEVWSVYMSSCYWDSILMGWEDGK